MSTLGLPLEPSPKLRMGSSSEVFCGYLYWASVDLRVPEEALGNSLKEIGSASGVY